MCNDLWPTWGYNLILLKNLASKIYESIHFCKPYDKTKNLTLFSEKLEYVSIFDPCLTLKVSGSHLGNATICGISEKCCLCIFLICHILCIISFDVSSYVHSVESLTLLTLCAQWLCLAALLITRCTCACCPTNDVLMPAISLELFTLLFGI